MASDADIVERIHGLRYVHVPRASQLLEEAAKEITRLRLTDEEREAITVACGDSSQWDKPHVATLMRLLERLK